MENDHGYLIQLFSLAWEATESGAFMVDVLVALFVVLVVRKVEKSNKLPPIFSFITKHPILEDDKLRVLAVSIIIFLLHVIFISPYSLYHRNKGVISKLEMEVDEKIIKLHGSIDQWMIFREPGTTNTILIPQIHLYNSGGASLAENYNLQFYYNTNNHPESKPMDIPDYFQWQSQKGNKVTVFRLFKQELISEKTSKKIDRGEGFRGWLAFRIAGDFSTKIGTNYNFTISFKDANNSEIFVTNWFKGNKMTNIEYFDIPRTLPGSVNLVWTNYELPNWIANGWMPPELPPDCTNVVICFGNQSFSYPKWEAEITDDRISEIPFSELTDEQLKLFENAPDFSPMRDRVIAGKLTTLGAFGGVSVAYPVLPFVQSNRLFLLVQIPFSDEKRKLVMSKEFDSQLPMRGKWDRNYSTNYDMYEGQFIYEVVNELKNPVLQVFYTKQNEIHVNGIFLVNTNLLLASFGGPPQFLAIQYGPTNEMPTNATFSQVLNFPTNASLEQINEVVSNAIYRIKLPHQRPIFKYPSYRNLGIFNTN